MLLIKEYSDDVNYRILKHGEDVFHKALEAHLKGERAFHVIGDDGIRYNLEYVENQSWAEASPDYPDSPLFHKDPLYPPYYFYDEHNRDRLCSHECVGLWSGRSGCCFDSLFFSFGVVF